MVLEQLLEELVSKLDNENIEAITLSGSHARGDATRYSDIDLICYVKQLPPERERYQLHYESDFLVSVSTSQIEDKRAELLQPQSAIWCVQSLRDQRILKDTDGVFAQLKAEVVAFQWTESLQAAADLYASELLVGYAEEAMKILGGIVRGDDSTVLYGTYGMALGMTRMLVIKNGILLRTENEYFERARQTVSDSPELLQYLDVTIGYENPLQVDGGLARMRGCTALKLYIALSHRMDRIILPEHRLTIEKTITMIQESGIIN